MGYGSVLRSGSQGALSWHGPEAPADVEITVRGEAYHEGGPLRVRYWPTTNCRPPSGTPLPGWPTAASCCGLPTFATSRVDASLRRVEVQVAEGGASLDRVAVFAAGALLSFILVMSGEPLLHASAVDVGGAGLAFVGRSGMGKSTMATLCCAAGGHLITDDVLRLTTGQPPRCYLGPDEIRLRAWATELTRTFSEPPAQRRTGDGQGRRSSAPRRPELLPLAAIVVPFPDRSVTEVALKRLDGMQSLLALLSFPRIMGWMDPVAHAQQFKLLSDVVGQVPVYQARIPSGPPFPDGVVQGIFEGTGTGAAVKRGAW